MRKIYHMNHKNTASLLCEYEDDEINCQDARKLCHMYHMHTASPLHEFEGDLLND